MTASMLLASAAMAARRRRAALTPPPGAFNLWRPSALSGVVDGDQVAALTDEGYLGWDLAAAGAVNPIFRVVGGVPCLAYSTGDNANLNACLRYVHGSILTVPQATGLFVFRADNNVTPTTQYIVGSNEALAANRLDFSRAPGSNGLFGYRGATSHRNAGMSLNRWQYAVMRFDGASSLMHVNGGEGKVSPVGSGTGVRGRYLGSYDTSTTYRFRGHVSDVGFWEDDNLSALNAYARQLLGIDTKPFVRGTSDAISTSSPYSVPLPAEVQNGDLMVMTIYVRQSLVPQVPDGWDLVANLSSGSVSRGIVVSRVKAPGDGDVVVTVPTLSIVSVAQIVAIANASVVGEVGAVLNGPSSSTNLGAIAGVGVASNGAAFVVGAGPSVAVPVLLQDLAGDGLMWSRGHYVSTTEGGNAFVVSDLGMNDTGAEVAVSNKAWTMNAVTSGRVGVMLEVQ